MSSDAFSSGGEEYEELEKPSQSSLMNYYYQHQLPRPNPIMTKEYSSKQINSAYELYPNFLDANRNYKTAGQNNSQDDEFQDIQFSIHATTLKDIDLPLIYQKYPLPKDRKYYASYLYNFKKSMPLSEEKEIYSSDTSVKFDSKFESGNLFQAFKKSEYEYILILQNDINTKGYTQWFYFSVEGFEKHIPVKFSIVNLVKNREQPVFVKVFSNNEWSREKIKARYFRNNILKEFSNHYYYTLSFQYTFEDSEKVFFASNYPYTYTHLNMFLKNIITQHPDVIVKRRLCQTLAMNDCDYLTITSKKHSSDKKGIVFLSRQHPGEVTSSFVTEGIIEYLVSANTDAQFLRENFVFKIIPMMNVDGVIHGNQRCSLSGVDMNRRWNHPNQQVHPSVYYSKQLMKHFHEKYPIELIIDLHGHSKKYGAFFYGNSSYRYKCNQQYPSIVADLNQQIDWENSRFNNFDLVEATARVSLAKMLNIQQVYTLETSMLGYLRNGRICEFTVEDLKCLGVSLCKGLLKQQQMTINEIKEDDELSVSDSNPSEDQIDEEIFKEKKVFRRKSFDIKQSLRPKSQTQSAKKPGGVQVVKEIQSSFNFQRKRSLTQRKIFQGVKQCQNSCNQNQEQKGQKLKQSIPILNFNSRLFTQKRSIFGKSNENSILLIQRNRMNKQPLFSLNI